MGALKFVLWLYDSCIAISLIPRPHALEPGNEAAVMSQPRHTELFGLLVIVLQETKVGGE